MNNWPTKKLTDLLESCDAGVWGKPAPEGKGLFVLRSTNMTNDGKLDFLDVAERKVEGDIKKFKLSDGDILVEKSGGGPDQPVGRVAYFVAPNQRTYSFANFIQRLRVNSDLMDSHFLFYRLLFLHKIGFTKKLQSQTTGIRNLKLSLYLKAEIPVPPLKIQKRIVERLDKIAEAQKLNDELIQKADELFQSLLHKEIQSQKGWETKKLREICEINPSKTEINGVPDDSDIGFLTMADVSEDAEMINIQTRKLKEVKKGFTYFRNGDVLFAKITPCMENGKGALAEGMKNGIGFGSTEFHVLRAKSEFVLNKLLYFIVNDKSFRKNAQKFMRGAVGQQRVPSDYLEKFKIPLPPIKTQKQIVEKLSAVQDYKKQLLEQKSKLKELFDSILNKSMKGELVK